MDIYKHLRLTLDDIQFAKETKEDRQNKVLELLKEANRELEKYYAGKYKFNIAEEDKVTPDKLELSPKKKRRIKEI